MLSAAELASIQSDAVKATCDKPCAIYRKTPTKDAIGSETDAWAQISPNGLMAGIAEPTANMLQNYDYLIGSMAAWHVRLPVGTNIMHQDHIVIGTHTLVVQKILEPRSYPALLSVLASEIS